jgi:gamma-glutamyltranspeptidase
MVHSGIGGGGFMLVRDSEGNYEAIGEQRDRVKNGNANTDARFSGNCSCGSIRRYV